jgi:hypothetical protein
MKPLLLLLTVCFGSLFANAQIESGKLPNFADKIDALKNLQRYSQGMALNDTAKQFFRPELFLTNSKPGVHRLPQDKMPCLVPDMNASVAMPNLWKGEIKVPFQANPPQIPNPGRRSRLSPSRPLLILPEQNDVTK